MSVLPHKLCFYMHVFHNTCTLMNVLLNVQYFKCRIQLKLHSEVIWFRKLIMFSKCWNNDIFLCFSYFSKSWLCNSLSKTLTLFSLSHFLTNFVVWLVSLDILLCGSLSSCLMPWAIASIFPHNSISSWCSSILWSAAVPLAAKQP